MEKLLKELQLMSSLEGEASMVKMQEIAAKYQAEEEKAYIKEYLDSELDGVENEIIDLDNKLNRMLTIKKQVKEVSEIVSLKYIAQHYFGKSAAWLSQRINGSPVRGKIYHLKDSELQILNYALQDIGKKLGSFAIG